MELRHLRYFVAVADELHFGRAAEKLFIAQPALSQQIQHLERELGVRLLERSSRRVSLSAAGAVFLAEARAILARVAGATEAARRADRGELGRLGVGFVASATYAVLPDVLRRFRERFPDVELLLYELTAAEQADALREGTINVGFARPFLEDPALIVEPVARENFVVALPEGHSLAAGESVPLADLAAEPFILFPSSPKPSYADTVYALCEGAGFTPQVAQEVREMQTAVSLIAAGLGVSLVPASVQNLRRLGVVYRPLRDPTPPTELVLAYRRDDSSPVLQGFLRAVRNNAPETEEGEHHAD